MHTNGAHEQPPPRRWNYRFRRNGALRRTLRYLGFLLLVVATLLCGGFLWFADTVTSLKPPDGVKADAIVVLTGGYQRIDQALGLLRDGAGRRLLISGAHPSVTPSQIRKTTQGSEDLFQCCVDVGYAAIDTIGNAHEITRWISDNAYRSVLVVTSNYHMPRSLLELRRVDHRTTFIPYPVVNADLTRKAWFTDPDALRTMLAEYVKMAASSLRWVAGMPQGTGLRSHDEIEKESARPPH
ncbi:YdcF family protein [Rhizobium sp. SSA_523]|uniref:YdcF family protein n=1 Tax=Rhizobium sp. SSA_523 TaxID=2952477 RepID=UPI0020907CA5|nr:ElyC/SanA/YdcF family protein [Rhizobium sp. SSA_523]MCO5733670.1 YdcF family protein [Rhizobium sp. SSA_523]WKC25744.1 ElyC/SanA/YdcF family protein [Rhizobium sp. SSA_523]